MNRMTTVSKLLRTTAAAVLLAAAVGAMPACVATSGRLYVRVGPPAPIVEVRAVSPGRGFIWVPGYYRWDGRGYIWMAGTWQRPPRARARWVPGHWARDRRHGWYFVEGRWR